METLKISGFIYFVATRALRYQKTEVFISYIIYWVVFYLRWILYTHKWHVRAQASCVSRLMTWVSETHCLTSLCEWLPALSFLVMFLCRLPYSCTERPNCLSVSIENPSNCNRKTDTMRCRGPTSDICCIHSWMSASHIECLYKLYKLYAAL